MATLSRPPSRELGLTRRLSVEETYHLADTARRKSSSEATRNDLRLRVGHSAVLEQLLHQVASLTESGKNADWPSSARLAPTSKLHHGESQPHIIWAETEVSKTTRYDVVDTDYADYDDGEEDLEGLSLVRTVTRKPQQ